MSAPASPLVLLGFDGFDWEVVRPLMQRGELPHLQKLAEAGVSGNLHTLEPVLSPLLWNTIATGKRASEHGIHGFVEVDEDTGKVRPVASVSRRCKALWNILEQNGRTGLVVNWFASHPAEPLRGAMVSDRLFDLVPRGDGEPVAAGAVHPAELTTTLAELRVRLDEIDTHLLRLFVRHAERVDQRNDRSLDIIAEEVARAYSIHAAATQLMQSRPWDFAAVYWRTPDLLCHHFMPYHPPAIAGADPARAELYGDVVSSVYRMFDLMVGAYVAIAGPQANIAIVSDHGFQAGRQRPPMAQDPFAAPEAWHRAQGVLILSGPAFRAGETVHGASLLDIAPTLLGACGLPAGLDMPGRVLLEALREQPPPGLNSWEAVPGPDGRHPPGTPVPPDDHDRLVRQFVQLGYIEPLSADQAEAADQCRAQNEWNLARDYAHQGRPFLALQLFEKLRTRWPDNLPLLRHTADCLHRIGLTQEARNLIEGAIRGSTPGPALLLLQSELATEAGDWAQALRLLQTLQAGTPASVGLSIRLGDAYFKLGQTEAAKAAYETALQLDPDAAAALQGLARVFLRQRFWTLAATHAFKAIGLHHNLPLAHYTLGLALDRLEHRREAAAALRSAIIYSPWSIPFRRVLIHLLTLQQAPAAEIEAEKLALARVRANREAVGQRVAALRAQRADAPALAPAVAPSPIAAPNASPPAPAATPVAEPTIVVTGLPRSGTSLMMKMLQAGGLPVKVDDERPADADNPEGYFEWQPVKRLASEPSLIAAAAGHAVKVISLLAGHLPRNAGYEYKFIFMRRPAAEVHASQVAMIRRRQGESAAAGMERQLQEHATDTLAQLERAFPGRVLVVDYPDLVRDPEAWTPRIAALVGVDRLPHLARMHLVVRPDLHRHRSEASR